MTYSRQIARATFLAMLEIWTYRYELNHQALPASAEGFLHSSTHRVFIPSVSSNTSTTGQNTATDDIAFLNNNMARKERHPRTYQHMSISIASYPFNPLPSGIYYLLE